MEGNEKLESSNSEVAKPEVETTSNEVSSNVIELPKPEVMELAEDEPHCYICLRAGVKTYGFHICRNKNCQKNHCVEHTSNVDLDKCSDCSEPVTVEVKKLSKTTTDYDEIRDEILSETHTAKAISFTGEHWLSNSVIISSLTDSQLKQSIEYNKAMVRMMEDELIHRRIQKSKQHLASTPFVGRKFEKRGVVSSVETTKTKRVVRKRSTASTEDKIMAALGGGNIDPQKLLDMLSKKLAEKMKA